EDSVLTTMLHQGLNYSCVLLRYDQEVVVVGAGDGGLFAGDGISGRVLWWSRGPRSAIYPTALGEGTIGMSEVGQWVNKTVLIDASSGRRRFCEPIRMGKRCFGKPMWAEWYGVRAADELQLVRSADHQLLTRLAAQPTTMS